MKWTGNMLYCTVHVKQPFYGARYLPLCQLQGDPLLREE